MMRSLNVERLPVAPPVPLRIELWDQARIDLDSLAPRERSRFEEGLDRLRSAVAIRGSALPLDGAQFIRAQMGYHQARLRIDWERGLLEVLSIAPEDDE